MNIENLRNRLRRLSRGDLLILAYRATEVLPDDHAAALFGSMFLLDDARGTPPATPLLDEVREFHDAAGKGEYYEVFHGKPWAIENRSHGTDAFIAELDRLFSKCVRAVADGPSASLREAFELLFVLLRRIDAYESIAHFADDNDTWRGSVDWRVVMPAYFGCLAVETSGEEFARKVDRTIEDFESHNRPAHLAAANRVANAAQKSALAAIAP